MNDREVWMQAGAILEAYGMGAAGYIIAQMKASLDDDRAIADWRRVAAAIDAIADDGAPQ